MTLKSVSPLSDAQKAGARLTLNKKKAVLGCSKSLQLVAKCSPAVYDTLTFTSSAPEIVSVNSTGLVTVNSDRKKGTAIITVKMADKTASCTITASPATSDSFSLDTSAYDKVAAKGIAVGKSVKIKTLFADTPANKKIIWSSDDPTVASVKNGLVKALSEGTTTIRATSEDDPRIQKTLTVKTYVPVKKLSLNCSQIRIAAGRTGCIKTIGLNPSEATDQTLSVSLSSKTKNRSASAIALIAVKKADGTVSSYGTAADSIDFSAGETLCFKGIGKGTVLLTLTAKDGSSRKASVRIRVTE